MGTKQGFREWHSLGFRKAHGGAGVYLKKPVGTHKIVAGTHKRGKGTGGFQCLGKEFRLFYGSRSG